MAGNKKVYASLGVSREMYLKLRLLSVVRSKTVNEVLCELIGDKLDKAVSEVPSDIRNFFMKAWKPGNDSGKV